MLHHAARVSKRTLLTHVSSPDVWPGSVFSTVLQVAAARAWARTVVRDLRTVSASTSVNLEKEDTGRVRKPLPDVPSDIDCRSRLNEREIFIAPSSSSARVDDDPLVDSGESSSKATRPLTRPATTSQFTNPPTLPKSSAPPTDNLSSRSTVHSSHISPKTTETRSRTPFQRQTRHIPYSHDLVGLPDSTSSLDLLNNLDKWRRRPPKPTITSFRSESPFQSGKPPKLNFETLHAYHARFPTLQTHRSFRVLAEIAINEAKFDAVRRLWIEMNRKGMLSDWDSLEDGGVSLRAVWVRWMVRQGKWTEAWKALQRWRVRMIKLSASRFVSEGLPHAIWIEFLGKAHKRVDRPRARTPSCPPDGEPPNTWVVVEGGELGPDERYKLLMRHPPHRNHSQITNVRPRTIYALIRSRLRLGDREWPMDIIRNWFERMGSAKAITDTKGNRACLRFLHLYLALAFPPPTGRRMAGSGCPRGFTLVREMEAVVNESIKLNPRVKPNSTTVLLLLRHLRQTSKCADNAARLVARYKRLYGNEVDDKRVRLQLAQLAVKQNNPRAFRRALVSPSTSTGVRWNEEALVRRRARLMRKRSSWLHGDANLRLVPPTPEECWDAQGERS